MLPTGLLLFVFCCYFFGKGKYKNGTSCNAAASMFVTSALGKAYIIRRRWWLEAYLMASHVNELLLEVMFLLKNWTYMYLLKIV